MVFVSKVCAGASTKPRTRHPNTEGDPEGARDGRGGEGDKTCCTKGRGEGVDLSGAFIYIPSAFHSFIPHFTDTAFPTCIESIGSFLLGEVIHSEPVLLSHLIDLGAPRYPDIGDKAQIVGIFVI